MDEIRLLIVDDHELVREGLTLLLEEAEEIVIAGQAGSVAQAVAQANALQPDVILLDMMLPDGDGVAVIQQLKAVGHPARIVVLTSFAEDEKIRGALQAGATGYLLKDVLRHELLAAIRAAAEGRPTLHPVVQSHLMQQLNPRKQATPLDSLTERERDVLKALAEGRSNKEIAATLGLTLGTVKGYVSTIFSKLDVASRTEATLLAIRNGLVNPNQS
ncbi:response regulator [Armatimonas rosea]|uniref:DNA-binding NarL/FixJ family response regulator n=1 Tax=Armatimonas rosea TaxID=685828 RepID=A0A7W9SWX5_ARMRO|nr:response regulator transcription factor [Armatimonas rosea]MBB6053459.1 DNA-binding NarL/FixJ family response regulator [Armatimonas rosea]